MIKSIKQIEYSIGGYSQGEVSYILDGSTISHWENEFAEMGQPPADYISSKQVNSTQLDSVKELFNQLDFTNWEKEYWEDVCDGEQWEIMVTYNGNLKKKIYGSNAYPKGFEKIERLLKSLMQ